ncbi:MAG TPA: alpha/beta hydrolase [Nitrososphaeraceae archaeon]
MKSWCVNSRRSLPAVIYTFITRINSPGVNPFHLPYKNGTTIQIDLSSSKSTEYISTLVIWGSNYSLIPMDQNKPLKQVLNKCKIKNIEDVGHAPFAEKTAYMQEPNPLKLS